MKRREALLIGASVGAVTLAGCQDDGTADVDLFEDGADDSTDDNGTDDDVDDGDGDPVTEDEEDQPDAPGEDDDEEADSEEADVQLVEARLVDDTIEAGEMLEIELDIENFGDADGELEVEITENGELISSTVITRAAGESRTTTSSTLIQESGELDLEVNGEDIGTLTVEAP